MLEKDLRSALLGEVQFDAGARALYSTDASNYRQVPIGVVLPKTTEDIKKTIDLCRQHGAPILSRGAGTSLAGQCCNVAVVMDMSKHMNHILEIDTAHRWACVEPGVILDNLRHQAEKYGLTFGPDPATHSRCTLGGMLGNNSCGVHAVAWGKTVDNVESLEVLTYDGLRMPVGPTTDDELSAILRSGGRRGEIYSKLKTIRDTYANLIRTRFPRIPRRVSGYNLDELLPENGFNVARALVGTEGTCVTILEAKLRLIPSPAARSLLVLGFKTIYEAAHATPLILTHKPIGLEGMDLDLITNIGRYQGFREKIKRLPAGEGWLLIEFGGSAQAECDAKASALLTDVAHRFHVSSLGPMPNASPAAKDLWSIRESVLAATAFVPGQKDRHEGWEDAAVPPDRLGDYLPELRALYDKYGYRGAFYGHFGDGCIHTRIDFDLDSPEGRTKTRAFLDEATDLVVRYGGSISGEHGDGQARAELWPKMFGPELMQAFREFKATWDPTNRMNPGKLIAPNGPPYSIMENLRMGEHFKPTETPTHFHFPLQENSFTRAILRCVGVGKCRNEDPGQMCPSYKVTRNEKDSTRGRAHLLFEMLQGETIKGGWKSEEVKEALDLCLSCKGCKSECPTNVDMASYKAEFLSHYYEDRLRPRSAYAFGQAARWLRLGAHVPRLANALTQTQGLKTILKWFAGMDNRRQIPKIANNSLYSRLGPGPNLKRSDSFAQGKRSTTSAVHPRVLLWPDTFTNHLSPSIGEAAIYVLERLGFEVALPKQSLCCGRPLYDYGMLDEAKRQLRQILEALQEEIEAGTPLVVLEPSCAAVFRDELLNLFPDDALALRLSQQTLLFSEFLLKASVPIEAADWSRMAAEMMGKSALLQTHCHQKSILSATADRELLERLGMKVSEPEAGCCGMAGSFGFEKAHADLSNAIAERALLPAVRSSAAETLIVASGFSCREQIEQGGGRRPQHVAEILEQALSEKKR